MYSNEVTSLQPQLSSLLAKWRTVCQESLIRLLALAQERDPLFTMEQLMLQVGADPVKLKYDPQLEDFVT